MAFDDALEIHLRDQGCRLQEIRELATEMRNLADSRVENILIFVRHVLLQAQSGSSSRVSSARNGIDRL
jgi:hypothetical protein